MRFTNSASAPTDGTTYTASTTFGNGSQIGTGTFVVYNGTDTTVTVTGLTANSPYSVGVWEYNGLTAGTQNYNSIAGSNQVSFLTTTTAPTTSPFNLTFSNVTPTSIQLNFTAGNGQGRIVVARPNSAVNVAPPSGVILTTGQQLGNGNFVAGITSGGSLILAVQRALLPLAMQMESRADGTFPRRVSLSHRQPLRSHGSPTTTTARISRSEESIAAPPRNSKTIGFKLQAATTRRAPRRSAPTVSASSPSATPITNCPSSSSVSSADSIAKA